MYDKNNTKNNSIYCMFYLDYLNLQRLLVQLYPIISINNCSLLNPFVCLFLKFSSKLKLSLRTIIIIKKGNIATLHLIKSVLS